MKIILDPGHGKKGGAMAATGQSEARTNFNVALFLAPLLMKQGHDIIFCRSSHEDSPSLETRMTQIKAVKPQLVISVHHNAYNGKVRGAEVLAQYRDRDGGKSKTLGEALLAQFAKTGQRSRGLVFKPNSTSTADYYGILRAAAEVGACAVITEYAFMDHEEDLRLIDTYDKQEQQAIAIAAAVAEYTNL